MRETKRVEIYILLASPVVSVYLGWKAMKVNQQLFDWWLAGCVWERDERGYRLKYVIPDIFWCEGDVVTPRSQDLVCPVSIMWHQSILTLCSADSLDIKIAGVSKN